MRNSLFLLTTILIFDMHFHRKHLVEYGYNYNSVLQPSLDTLSTYTKYFPEHFGVVAFSTIHNNKVVAFRLTQEQYEGYMKGDFSLSISGGVYISPQGWEVKDYGRKEIFQGGEIKNRKTLKGYLDLAEQYVTAEKEPTIIYKEKIVQ